MPDLIQLQAAALVVIGLSTTGVNGWKIFRNHELRRGITMARWFALGAGLAISVLYLMLMFTAQGLPPDLGRAVVMLSIVAVLIYSILV